MPVLVGLLLGACAGESPDEPPATSALSTPTANVALPPTLDHETAERLIDRVAATGRFVDLPQDLEAGSDELDDGEVCDQAAPRADDRLATQRNHFLQRGGNPQRFLEVSQETVVYRTEIAAEEQVTWLFDTLEECARWGADQVHDHYAAVTVPDQVGRDARAVSARMTIAESGNEFAHRFGCVLRGPVVQCIRIYTSTDSSQDPDEWLERALIAVSDTLAEHVPATR